jgi:MSHA biogenesis protein MshG
MQRFAYQSRDVSGALSVGEIEADSSSGVATQLRARGLTAVSIKLAAGHVASTSAPTSAYVSVAANDAQSAAQSAAQGAAPKESPKLADLDTWLRAKLGFAPAASKVSDVELQLLTRELYAMLKAGVPIMRALGILMDSTANPEVSLALQRISATLGSGVDFAAALEKETQATGLFSPYYISIVRIGETTGRLEECLLRLSKHLQFLRATKEQLLAAIRYPAFVILAALAAIVVINIFVIPQFEKVFRNLHTELPLLTRILLGSSKFITTMWPLLLVGTAASVFGTKLWLNSESGASLWDRWKLKLPIAGDIVQRTCLARFCVSFSVALRSGVPLTQALSIVADNVGNRVFSMHIHAMRERVERGESVKQAAASEAKLGGIFPNSLIQVIAVGEETGALAELLEELGSHFQSEVEYELSRLTARLEPILITVLGGVVLVLALGVFLPMWELGRASIK